MRPTRPLLVTKQMAVIFAASFKKSCAMNGWVIRWSDGAWQIMPDITLVGYHNRREVSHNFLAHAYIQFGNCVRLRGWLHMNPVNREEGTTQFRSFTSE
jgi:hypothetical protein